MFKSKSKKLEKSVKKFNRISALIERLQKERELLRESILEVKSYSDMVVVGNNVINFTDAKRHIFDKKSYLKKHGENSLDNYTKSVAYTVVKIKAI